jgi:hypothetical protein
VDAAHIHLMINHLPIIGTPLVAGLMLWGLLRRSRELQRTAMGAAIMVAALTYPVFLTGEPAEERVEDSSWMQERLVHEHEERAEAGLIAILLTGMLGAVVLWQSRGGRSVPIGTASLTLGGLVVSSGLLGWAALAGGVIRHDELRGGAASAVSPTADSTTRSRQGGHTDGDRDD